jgi:foldase protein PrsA
MRTRRFIALSSIAVVVASALVACGGTTKKEVPANAIAVVGDQVVLRSQYDAYLAQATQQYKDSGKTFPAVGSAGYETIKNQIVSYLVKVAARYQEASSMGIEIKNSDVDASLTSLIKQRFNGNQAKYQKELKKEHLTEQQLRDGIRQNLISQRVQTAMIANVKVSDSEIEKYYNEHKSSYRKAESRKASHILVKTKTQAESIYQQLQAGAKFATLAKKNSLDPGSKSKGGSLGLVEKGTMVPAFEKALFALKTGSFSKPFKSTYGWHIVLAVGPIKPAYTQSLKQAKSTIQSTLLQTKQSEAVTNWVKEANKYATDHTTYAPKFRPAKSSASTVATTTTS